MQQVIDFLTDVLADIVELPDDAHGNGCHWRTTLTYIYSHANKLPGLNSDHCQFQSKLLQNFNKNTYNKAEMPVAFQCVPCE